MINKLENELLRACVTYGSFKSSSGVTSNWHFDKYQILADPLLLEQTALALMRIIPQDTESIAAVEMGAIPIASIICNKAKLPLTIIRKSPKLIGGNFRIVEGHNITSSKYVILDDVIDSGKSMSTILSTVTNFIPYPTLVMCIMYRGSNKISLEKKFQTPIISLLNSSSLNQTTSILQK